MFCNAELLEFAINAIECEDEAAAEYNAARNSGNVIDRAMWRRHADGWRKSAEWWAHRVQPED